jgi:hypothetical protein
MRFKKILRSPTSTNHSLNARSPLGNDEHSFAVRGTLPHMQDEAATKVEAMLFATGSVVTN